jgi:hypothetical protein
MEPPFYIFEIKVSSDGHISSGWSRENMYFVYIIKKCLSIDWKKNPKKRLSLRAGCGIVLPAFDCITCLFIIQSLHVKEREAPWPSD